MDVGDSISQIVSEEFNLKTTSADSELLRRIDEVVHYIWDPIGVSGSPHARDEYQSYLTEIAGHVQADELDAIVEYMKWVATDRMGLSFDKTRATRAAETMLEWKRVIESQH